MYNVGISANRPLTCNILRDQEEHRRAGLFCSTFPVDFHHLSYCFCCQSRSTFGRKPSHPVLPCLISTLSPVRTLVALVGLSPISSILHFPRLVLQVLHAVVTLPMICPFFPLCSQRSNSPTSSYSFFKICAPPLHAAGFVILCRSPALQSTLLII